ncbi:hypothetical protein EON65_07150 [archaeon]|nr:MAG: hypothetical protein EON65_07150 [archaeon]
MFFSCICTGFFAPEMIIHGSYFGDKADVWSVGCIILELVLGHERFCDTWMTAYDYEVLQDKGLFTQTIENTVNELHDHLDFSSELNDFIPRFLELRSSKRPFIKALAGHGWLGDLLMDDLIGGNGRNKLSFDAGRPLSPPGGLSPSPSFNHGQFPSTQVSQETINAAYRNWSEKERKHMEDYIQHHQDDDDHHLHLPPIIPATPSIHGAKKILRKGDELASKATASLAEPSQAGFWSPGGGNCNTESPHSSSKSYHTPLRNSIHLPMVVEGQEDQLNDSGKVPTGEERANSAPLLQLGGAFEVELEKSDSKPTLKSSISSGLMLGGGAK